MALLFPCESALHAVQLFLRFQLPNPCSPGLAASLPCSHTRVRAPWAYSCLGQATRARAPIAPPAPSARAPLNTCPHHPLPYAIACTLAPPTRRRSRSCRSSSRTCSTPVRLHRTASAHAGAVRANSAAVVARALCSRAPIPPVLPSSCSLSLSPQLLHSPGAHAPAPANPERQNRAAASVHSPSRQSLAAHTPALARPATSRLLPRAPTACT
jgi:hypothetical protein